MKLLNSLVLFLCLATNAFAYAPLTVFVPNNEVGVCWWASAESILRSHGYPLPLVDIVVKDGTGYLSGAKLDDLDHYSQYFSHREVTKYQLYETVALQHTNVIATVYPWTFHGGEPGCHAIVLIDFVKRGNEWRVRYWDCNEPNIYSEMSWVNFAKMFRVGTVVTRPTRVN